MNFKFLFAQQAWLSGDTNARVTFNDSSRKAYNEIISLTDKYNNTMSNGKWNKIMDMQPRDLAAYKMPDYQLSDSVMTKQTSADYNREISPIFLQANEFSRVINAEGFEWRVIRGLGYSDASMSLFPFKNAYFNEAMPYIEYSFNIDQAGIYEIEVRCLPTHSNNFDHQVTIQVNSGEQKQYDINTKGRSEAWKKNILRNFVPVKDKVSFTEKGNQTLKIYVNQPGIVIDQIAVNPVGYPDYYEINH